MDAPDLVGLGQIKNIVIAVGRPRPHHRRAAQISVLIEFEPLDTGADAPIQNENPLVHGCAKLFVGILHGAAAPPPG